MSYEEFSDDEDFIIKCVENNQKLNNNLEEIKSKLNYYQQEYEKYLDSIGLELNDRTYDEILFNLLNNGIILD